MKKIIVAMAFAMLVSPSVHAAEALVVYSAGPKALSSALAKAFTKKTGIEVSQFQSSSGKVMARYQAEKSNPHADVMVSASWGHAISLAKAGDLLAYSPKNAATVPANLKTAYYTAEGAAALSIAYNTKSGLPVPRQWSDLAKPVYANQITMPDPAKSGSALTLVEGLVSQDAARAWALFAQLKRNKMIVPGANKAALRPVLQGARGIVFGAVDYIVLGAKAKGETIDVVYPSKGTVLAPRPIMILKTAKHLVAAKKFVDFVLSKEGQKLVADRFILPARIDVKAKRPGWNALNIINFNAVAAANTAVETKKKFAQVVGR